MKENLPMLTGYIFLIVPVGTSAGIRKRQNVENGKSLKGQRAELEAGPLIIDFQDTLTHHDGCHLAVR